MFVVLRLIGSHAQTCCPRRPTPVLTLYICRALTICAGSRQGITGMTSKRAVEAGKGPVIPDQGRLALGVGKAIPRHWWSERVPGQYILADAGGDFDCRFPDGVACEVRIPGGGLDLRMPEQFPNHWQALAQRQGARCKRVPKIVLNPSVVWFTSNFFFNASCHRLRPALLQYYELRCNRMVANKVRLNPLYGFLVTYCNHL